uniref:classical arabinogalactan protein 6-like n=1 Tax=Fragaria vesca subsp. vesca TaxID=101020 RepID=UPI0005C87854|nr:PREDICTED: classical arabinogalactan protein 6-like [Fragaria vesca subsp. vesca]
MPSPPPNDLLLLPNSYITQPSPSHPPPPPPHILIPLFMQCFSKRTNCIDSLTIQNLMARQDVLLVALALLATGAFAANGPTASPDKPKPGLPTFAAVPSGAAGPTSDSNEVGTVSGGSDGAGAPAAGGSSIADALAAGVGGPISEKTFGTAEAPKSGATAIQVSAGAAITTIAAASFF